MAEEKLRSAPKRRKKRRAGTFDDVLGPAMSPAPTAREDEIFGASVATTEPTGTVETTDPPDRAPP